MNKKNYSIIGRPIAHSLSPTLHNYWFKKYKIHASYELCEINEDEIEKIINKIRNKEISGINVTLPYKQKVIPFIDRLVNDAKESNSVNTIYLNEKNEIIGENTDVYGMQAGYLKELAYENISKKKVLVIGAGGVSPSIIVALMKSGAKDISLINRTYNKSIILKKGFKNINIYEWSSLAERVKDFDIIINATSLGLRGTTEFPPVFNNTKDSLIYIDTIYNPLQTVSIKNFKKKGIKTFNGLDMFVYQGQKSFYLWSKVNPEIDDKLIELLKSKIQ